MSLSKTMRVAAFLPTFAAIPVIVVLAQEPGQKSATPAQVESQKGALRKAMLQKLRSVQDVIAALAIEDYEVISSSASMLKRIGSGTLGKATPDLTYIKFSSEFTSLAADLEARAKEGDLNGATLSYLRMTINCVECHKHVRTARLLEGRPKDE